MEDRRSQYGAGVAFLDSFHQVFKVPGPAGGYHRYGYCVGYRTCERDIKALFGAVAIHGGEQYFPCTEFSHATCPFHRINTGSIAAAMGKNFEFIRRYRLRINGNDNTLHAEFL